MKKVEDRRGGERRVERKGKGKKMEGREEKSISRLKADKPL